MNRGMNRGLSPEDMEYLSRVKEAYKEVWSTPAGKMVLKDLLHFGGFINQPSDRGDTNPYTVCRDQGRRDVSLYIGDQLSWDDTDFLAHYAKR